MNYSFSLGGMSVLSPLRRDMNPEASTIKALSSIQEQLKWYAVIIIVILSKMHKNIINN